MNSMISENKETKLATNELYLRRATEEDKDLLYEWTNDPLTRRNSFSTSPISYSDHCRWFDVMIKDANRIQYIMMNGERPVGQIRLDVDGNKAEISYSVAAECRSKGYGKSALYLIRDEVQKNLRGIEKLIGQVKPTNEASAMAFIKEGYVETFRQFELRIER